MARQLERWAPLGGIIFVVLMAVGAMFVAYAIGLRDATVSDPDFVRVLPQMAWMILLLGAGFAGLLLVLATSILSLQTGVLPRWLAWLGIVVAIACRSMWSTSTSFRSSSGCSPLPSCCSCDARRRQPLLLRRASASLEVVHPVATTRRLAG
jgi:hypothetical protein